MAKARVYSTLSKIGYPLFGSKISEVRGLENLPKNGSFLIAANHIDWLDGFFITTAIGRVKDRPVYFLVKSKSYWWTTIILPIPKRKQDSIDQAAQYIRQGKTLAIFPEGERNPSQKLYPGKTGVVRIALAAGVPIVPLGLICSYGRNVGQSLVNLMSKNHQVKIRIGRPITTTAPSTGVTNVWLHQETARVMKAIAPLCNKSL